jgi:hypothetical protein
MISGWRADSSSFASRRGLYLTSADQAWEAVNTAKCRSSEQIPEEDGIFVYGSLALSFIFVSHSNSVSTSNPIAIISLALRVSRVKCLKNQFPKKAALI